MSYRCTVSLKPKVAMHVTRVSTGHDKLVYIIQTDKKLSYDKGRSRIAYIGTTKNGLDRIAASVAERAYEVLNLHGVHELTVRVVTCSPVQSVKTWKKLERAMLICFKRKYGESPWFNTQGKSMEEYDEFDYFTHTRIQNILEELS